MLFEHVVQGIENIDLLDIIIIKMTKCDIVRLINTSINLYLANTRISQVQVIKWLMTILASIAIWLR